MTKRCLFYFFLLWIPAVAFTQNSISYLKVTFTEDSSALRVEDFSRKIMPDESYRIKESIFTDLFEQGYITASEDTSFVINDTLFVKITQGPVFKWLRLTMGNAEPDMMDQINFREKGFKKRIFHYEETKSLMHSIIRYYENHGYPFAAVSLDSIKIDSQQVSASLLIQKHQMITIDSIIIKGNASIQRTYIEKYLNVKTGDIYNEAIIKKMDQRIRELDFVKAIKSAEVGFYPDKARIYLYLEKYNANQFDGIIGLIPNDKTSGKLLLTGELRLNLKNIFSRGEHVQLHWKSLEQGTQILHAGINYPYILATDFGLAYALSIYKKDTSYLNVNQKLGVQYLFSGQSQLSFFYSRKQTSLLSTAGMENIASLPQQADTRSDLYGLSWRKEELDYRFNPRKGFHLNLSGSLGSKKIQINNKLPLEIYDSLKLNTTQFEGEAVMGIFIPLFYPATLYFKSRHAWIMNEELFENELFRIGGLNDLRGFDELSISASMIHMLSVEFRYLLEENSYMCVFWNGAYYEKTVNDQFLADRPFGFGAGISFETAAGIFSVNYALGKQFNNPVDFRSAKIHFGIVNVF